MITQNELEKIKKYLIELYEKAYNKSENKTLGCLQRSQLLYLRLKKDGYISKIMKITIEGNKNKNFEDKELIEHSCGIKVPSHIVVLLEGLVLDANIDEILSQNEYEIKHIKSVSGKKIIWLEEMSTPDIGLCRQYVDRYDLTSFKELFD